jgi:hypothetical protein
MSPSLDSMVLQVSPATVLCLWLHVASLSPTQTTEPGKGVRISHSASGLSLAYVVLLMLPKALHGRYEKPSSSAETAAHALSQSLHRLGQPSRRASAFAFPARVKSDSFVCCCMLLLEADNGDLMTNHRACTPLLTIHMPVAAWSTHARLSQVSPSTTWTT